MNHLLLLIPVALGLGLVGLLAFVWSLNAGQYDDMEGAAVRIFDKEENPDSPPRQAAEEENKHGER